MTNISQKILGLVLGTTEAAAAPCEGASYTQYACWVRNRIPTRFMRTCYNDRCDRRTYCGAWRGYQCVAHC